MSYVRALMAGLALVLPAAPAFAADQEATASQFGVFRPNDDLAVVATVCIGEAIRTTATVVVTCEISDETGVRSSATCESPVSRGTCTAAVADGVIPVTSCSSVVATFSDGHTASHRQCITYT